MGTPFWAWLMVMGRPLIKTNRSGGSILQILIAKMYVQNLNYNLWAKLEIQ